jgi:predicted kinase
MERVKLLVLKGLPASGKSTYAKTLVDQGWVRSNKDEIRKRLFEDNYKRKDEKKVIKERNRIVHEALSQNRDVVVDDTNLNPVHIKDLMNIAKQYNATFKVDDSFLDVPLLVCIERDKHREEAVGEQVIREMYHKYIKRPKTAIEYDPLLPNCYISDIDGTLANMGDRSPYEWHKVGLDTVNSGVAHVLDALKCINYAKVFLFSGRDEVCRPETEEWLERNDIEYDGLYMRRTNHLDDKGNQVKDTEVKREMLERYIVGKYNVLGIFDDRPVVCRMWKDEFGLTVFNVGDPYWEF